MSAQTPPRLLDLVGRCLLRADGLDFSALESLPMELFPPFFLEAFGGYQTKTLKAMVQTWPFVRLPLGALIDLPHVGPLQAVLEALDVLLAQKRKSSIHLCCKKLEIVSMPMDNIVKVLSMVQLDCIQEVQVSCTWNLPTLATFAPFLGEMSHLQRLRLSHAHVSAFKKQEHDHLVHVTSQFRRLGHLRDLHLESPSFLEGCLDQMLRCLKTSLYNISITNCLLTESDLTHLSQCRNICQLKGLNLNGVTLTNFHPELLQVLLEKVAGTLEELDLNLCGIMDSHLMAILPVLSSCSQLRVLSICGNLISMAVLESLLCHTDGLSDLSLELYPAPRESYSSLGILHQERLAQLKAELWEILTDLGRPRKIWVSPSPCPYCGDDMCDHLSPNA
ncbi:unnamed protein product [Rangifer tarandus platyrhynchus]|uniref:Uncharacterized protein n=1 Tax=Rangifer tarandus platyrhynchus TaxID=3082113 RepID=A0AC60AAE4_RANTA